MDTRVLLKMDGVAIALRIEGQEYMLSKCGHMCDMWDMWFNKCCQCGGSMTPLKCRICSRRG